jgi:hypothetical protein
MPTAKKAKYDHEQPPSSPSPFSYSTFNAGDSMATISETHPAIITLDDECDYDNKNKLRDKDKLRRVFDEYGFLVVKGAFDVDDINDNCSTAMANIEEFSNLLVQSKGGVLVCSKCSSKMDKCTLVPLLTAVHNVAVLIEYRRSNSHSFIHSPHQPPLLIY